MKRLYLSVHNYYPSDADVNCSWTGEFAGESSDPRCVQLEDDVIHYIERLEEAAGWPDKFILNDDQVENLKWFVKVRADRIFTDVDTDELLSVNVYSQQP